MCGARVAGTQLLGKEPEINNSIKMEVGIEECLHIEFEYNKSKCVPAPAQALLRAAGCRSCDGPGRRAGGARWYCVFCVCTSDDLWAAALIWVGGGLLAPPVPLHSPGAPCPLHPAVRVPIFTRELCSQHVSA